MEQILERLIKIENLIVEQNLNQKEFLSFGETMNYLGVSDSYLYKLTSGGILPYYKPTGKIIFFKREELNDWLQSNRKGSRSEYRGGIDSFKLKKGGK